MFTAINAVERKRTFGNRRLVVIDIENIIGGAAMTKGRAEWGRHMIESLTDISPDEQVIIGSCREGFINVKTAWENARVVVRGGTDAADLALIDVMDNEDLASRYSEILLISGDHIFTDSVRALTGTGTPVTIASWRSGLSAQLVAAASNIIVLDDVLSNITYVKAA